MEEISGLSNKTIVIGGYYGAHNLGDEAILSVLLDRLRSPEYDGVTVIVVSNSPELTERMYPVKSVWWRDIPSIARVVQKSDMVIIGGGGLFMDYWGIHKESYFRATHGGITTYGTLALLSRAFGVPYVICGVGIGPIKSQVAREETREILSGADRVVLRDPNSLDLLKEIGLDLRKLQEVIVSTDVAFAMKVSSSIPPRLIERFPVLGSRSSRHPLLGVSIRFWDFASDPSEWIPSVAKGVRKFLLSMDANALLIPFQHRIGDKYTDDLQISQVLAKEIGLSDRVFIISEDYPLVDIQAILGECDLILGMRFHSIVIGINKHIPVIAIAYDPKITSLMRSVGFEEFVCEMPPDANELTEKMLRAFHSRHVLSRRLEKIHLKMKGLAESGIARCFETINHGRPQPSCDAMEEFIIDRLSQMQRMDLEQRRLLEDLNICRGQVGRFSQELESIKSSRTYKLAAYIQRIWGIFR